MATISFNPTKLSESILEGNQDIDGLELTGILDLESVEVYGAVLSNLDSTAIRYGCSLTNNCVIMNADDIPDYIEELTTTLIELAGVSELDLSPVKTDQEEDLPKPDALKAFTKIGSIVNTDPEYPDYEKPDYYLENPEGDDLDRDYLYDPEDPGDTLELDAIISDHISECLLKCLVVLTGTHEEVTSNKIDI